MGSRPTAQAVSAWRPWPPAQILRLLLAFLVTVMLAVTFGVASTMSPAVAGLVLFGAGVCVLFVLPLTLTLAALVIAFMLPLTQLDLGIDTRLLTPALLLPLAVKASATRRTAPGQDIALRLVPLCLVAVASLTWTQDVYATGVAALALIAVSACLYLVPASIERQALLHSLRWLAGATIILCTAATLAPLGQLAGRSRGVFANPNALAILLMLSVPLLMKGRWRLLLPVVVALAFTTASRAGMAALVVGVFFYVLSARTRRLSLRIGAVLVVVAALAVVVLGLNPTVRNSVILGQPSEISVFRYENSRDFEWAGAMQLWREHPLVGHGFGASSGDTGSSYLKLLVDLGLLGVVVALPFLLLLLLRLVTSHDPLVVASIASSLVSSIFEAWLLTAGSAFFVLFCLILQTEEGGRVADGHHDP